MSRLIILTGQSSSGKDTAQDKLISDYGYRPLILYTTRPMRPNEQNGVDYVFVTEESFKNHIDTDVFVYYATFNAYEEDGGDLHTWYYGLRKRKLKSNSVVVTDIDHIKPIKDFYESLGDEVVVVMLDVPVEEREQRARNRQGDSFCMDEWLRRVMDETVCYSADKINELVDIVVDNTRVDAIDDLMVSLS